MRLRWVRGMQVGVALLATAASGLCATHASSRKASAAPAARKKAVATHRSSSTSSANRRTSPTYHRTSASSSSHTTRATRNSVDKARNVSSHASSTKASATTKTRRGKSTKHSSKRDHGQKVPAADRISQIQEALAKDGSFTGTPNGKFDDSTTEALKRFQMSHGLNATGKLDAHTLQQLGLGSQTAGIAAPIAPAGSSSRLTSSIQSSPR